MHLKTIILNQEKIKIILDNHCPIGDNKNMYKIIGNYQGNTQDEIIDEDFHTTGYARRMLTEYVMAFGPNWGPMWIVDKWGNKID